ncbi:MAG: rhomboid family intramembrane serine protease [Bacteroidetes bacterium]|nr:rhomboid family intramembrane serine protease [Bacteroidota bacterium]MBU1720737.1 rhomboid family intramembrane serine protease [Bacteroidota bacterium]
MIIFIIICTIAISVFAFYRQDIFRMLTFNPYLVLNQKEFHRILSHGFVHADWVHLGINMFVLYSFGVFIEDVFKVVFGGNANLYLSLLYFGAIVLSVLPAFIKHHKHPEYNSVGASGAVSAIVFASIMFNPLGKIYLFFIPIGIPSFIFGFLYLIYSAVMAKRGRDNIGHEAHFAGAVYGVLFIIIAEPAVVRYFIFQIQEFFR